LYKLPYFSNSQAGGRPVGAIFSAYWLHLLYDELSAQRERWILWGPVMLGAGIAIYFSLPTEPPVVWGGAILAAALGLSSLRVVRRSWLIVFFAGAAAAALGFCTAQLRTMQVAAPLISAKPLVTVLSGRVTAIERRSQGNRLTLQDLSIDRLVSEETPLRVRVRVGRLPAGLTPGRRVTMKARLMAPPGPSSPGGFDFSRLAWFQRIGGVGYAISRVLIEEPVGNSANHDLTTHINALRHAVSERIRQLSPGVTGGLAAALLTGDRGGISQEAMSAMRDSGLAHLLAISGLHIGLVTMTLFFLLRFGFACIPVLALRHPIKKWAAAGALFGSFCYFLLAGMTVPTQRAFIMMAISLSAVMLERNPISLRLVAIAASMILLWQPESLMSVSFQMSFAAVVVLVALYETVAPRFAHWRQRSGHVGRIWLYLATVALTTIAASAATAPFAVYHFHKIANFGLIANLFAVPVMAFWVMPMGLLALLLLPFGLAALPLVFMGIGIEAILWIATTVSGLKGATYTVQALPESTLVLATLSGLWLCLWQGRIRFLAMAGFLAALPPTLSARPPDMLVSGDGTVFAVRSTLGVHTPPKVRRGRVLEDWLARWGRSDVTIAQTGLSKPLACDHLACLYRNDQGNVVSYVFDRGALAEDCHAAQMIVATFPVGRSCRPQYGVIDRYDLWREGAHAIWIDEDGIITRTVAEHRGKRPWIRNRGNR
jgi:competence protein ComEC